MRSWLFAYTTRSPSSAVSKGHSRATTGSRADRQQAKQDEAEHTQHSNPALLNLEGDWRNIKLERRAKVEGQGRTLYTSNLLVRESRTGPGPGPAARQNGERRWNGEAADVLRIRTCANE
jgi:hypothetical protein